MRGSRLTAAVSAPAPPTTIAPSLQAGIISSVTVGVSCLLFGPQLGAISLLGSMLALWESKRPLWARVRNGLLIASTMSLSMALGVVAPYRFNYFLALILVTPMSLLAIDATGQGGPPARLLADRFLGTLIGMAIALIITWATSYRFPERLLRAQYTRVETAIAAVEGFNADGTANTAAGRRARVELSYELTHHHSVLDRAAAEDPPLKSLTETDDGLMDNGYTALAKAWL